MGSFMAATVLLAPEPLWKGDGRIRLTLPCTMVST